MKVKPLLSTITVTAAVLSTQASGIEEMKDTVALGEVCKTEIVHKPLQKHSVGMLGIDVPLKYLPMTVSRLDAKTLERKHIVNLEDAVRFLPGVIESGNQLGQFKRFSVRGSNDVAIAYDGVRDERVWNNVPFGDLSGVESIEVIKGPAAILAGHSVMGGVINIRRKKPTDKFTANGSVSYGSWKQKDASIGFGGKLIGPVHYRAHAFTSNGDGYRMVNANRLSGLFALSSRIGKHGFWEASINGADDSYTTDIGGAPTMPANIYYAGTDKLYLPSGSRNPLCNYENVYNDIANNRMRRRLMEISTSYIHTFNDKFKLRERAFYSHSDLDYCCVEGLTYVTSETPGDYKYQYTSRGKTYYTNLDEMRSGTPLNFNPDHKTFSNTLELTGTINTSHIVHKYIAGWTTTYFDFTQYNGYADDDVWGPGKNEIISVEDPHYVRDWWDCKVSAANISRNFNNGFYLTDVIDVNVHWKGMLSFRYDTYTYRRATAKITDGRQHYDKENRTPYNRVSTGAFTYRAGAVYLPIPQVSVYASAASFFKPYNTFYNANYIYYDRNGHEFKPDMDGGEVYRPERGNQFEAGIRYEHRLFDINASVFLIKKRNVVTNIGKMPVEENGEMVEKTVQAQVGQYDSRGFDIDVTVHPWSTLNITAGLGWSDYRRRASNMDWAEGLSWITLNEDGQINLRATGVPRTTGYICADYTVPEGVLKGLSIHLSGTYTDRIYRDLTNNVYDPSRFIVDGGLYYTIKDHITLSLIINNLFDKHYFASATRLAKPRNFMTTISYSF
ncbi:TonB-dependent receptor [uncultured Duncaniella sp.]|uniref:TonB-dependent siderophore receptor n=1 Tax=uncultured Duncaniella sp. TaxID=2768039 RepID=UPI00260860A1|nr:TonB-dependent receptor [uncultured Duncaniella sp.]